MQSRHTIQLALILGSIFLLSFRCQNDYADNSVTTIEGVLVDELNNPIPNFDLYLGKEILCETPEAYNNQRLIKTDNTGRFSFLTPRPVNSNVGMYDQYHMLKFLDTSWHAQQSVGWDTSTAPYIILPITNEFNTIDVGTVILFQP